MGEEIRITTQPSNITQEIIFQGINVKYLIMTLFEQNKIVLNKQITMIIKCLDGSQSEYISPWKRKLKKGIFKDTIIFLFESPTDKNQWRQMSVII